MATLQDGFIIRTPQSQKRHSFSPNLKQTFLVSP